MIYIGIIGQSVAAIVLIVGVTLQIESMADLGNLTVSIGAVIFAVFTKIRLIGYELDEAIQKGRKKGR